MNLFIKLKGILRPKSARRTLATGKIFGPRANKQFDIAFWVFWTWLGAVGHSDSLIFKPRWLCVNTLYVDANARPQGHRHLLARLPGIFCCGKALGLGTHFGAKAGGSRRDGNGSNWYLHNNFHVWESGTANAWPQGHRHLYSRPRPFSVVQKPWGWAHISVQKPWVPWGDGNQSNWHLHKVRKRCKYQWYRGAALMILTLLTLGF